MQDLHLPAGEPDEPGTRRREQMEADCDDEGGAIPCHQHIHQDAPVEPVCRGYYDHAVADGHVLLGLATAMGIVSFTNVKG